MTELNTITARSYVLADDTVAATFDDTVSGLYAPVIHALETGTISIDTRDEIDAVLCGSGLPTLERLASAALEMPVDHVRQLIKGGNVPAKFILKPVAFELDSMAQIKAGFMHGNTAPSWNEVEKVGIARVVEKDGATDWQLKRTPMSAMGSRGAPITTPQPHPTAPQPVPSHAPSPAPSNPTPVTTNPSPAGRISGLSVPVPGVYDIGQIPFKVVGKSDALAQIKGLRGNEEAHRRRLVDCITEVGIGHGLVARPMPGLEDVFRDHLAIPTLEGRTIQWENIRNHVAVFMPLAAGGEMELRTPDWLDGSTWGWDHDDGFVIEAPLAPFFNESMGAPWEVPSGEEFDVDGWNSVPTEADGFDPQTAYVESEIERRTADRVAAAAVELSRDREALRTELNEAVGALLRSRQELADSEMSRGAVAVGYGLMAISGAAVALLGTWIF